MGNEEGENIYIRSFLGPYISTIYALLDMLHFDMTCLSYTMNT